MEIYAIVIAYVNRWLWVAYAMENSQELNKYGQSVTTRRHCFVITNQKCVFSIGINVKRTKKNLTWLKERKKVKKEHAQKVA